ncbi:AcrR family transcriptional regulator [Bradyrhizobium sp. i1.7.7]
MRRARCSGSGGCPARPSPTSPPPRTRSPSQITYYFRTKEALFVECACRELLYLARATEQAALKARTPRDYTRALAETVTASDSVAFFAEALTLTRRRQDLAPLVERTIERLHGEGARAYASQVARHGWRSLRAPDESSRRFWAVAIGVILEGYAMGRSPDELCAEMLRVLGEQAKSASDTARLRLVDERDASGNSNEEG